MPSKENWAEDYVECFGGQAEGWPLYQPIKSTALKPGMCGYFDVDGIWQTIVDLTDPNDVKAKEFPPVHGVTYSSGNLAATTRWGVRKSSHVRQDDISASVAVNIPGAPAGGAIAYRYSATSDKGAVLITKGPVKYCQATPNGPLCDWVVENGREILRRTRKPKRGVWVVTKTYSSNHRCLTVLSSKGAGVTVGIDVSALKNTTDVRASPAFWNTHSGELWNTDHDENGIVLAMCGIQWKTRWYSSKVKPLQERREQKLDGEDGDLILRPYHLKINPVEGEEVDDDNDAVRVEPEIWGDVEGVQIGEEEDDDEEEEES